MIKIIKQNKKVPPKTREVFIIISCIAIEIWKLANIAACEKNEKKRDKIMERIMDLSDGLEKEYSTNWH